MSRRKLDDHEPVIVDEYDDSGATQEPCPESGCAGTQRWRRGKHDNRFLGCSKYPKCKWTSYRKKKAKQNVDRL